MISFKPAGCRKMTNKLLLCSDLDRTLIPNGSQPESTKARQLFRRLVKHPEITLAYVTGRDKALIKRAIIYYNLPSPDYVIADVGATIYKLNQHQWQRWEDWESGFAQDWMGKTNNDIAMLFTDIKELRKQEVNKQKKYKLSYYVPLYIDYHSLIQLMQNRLQAIEINAALIWSIDEPSGIGLLDVMPEHATKRNAIEFLMQENQFDYNNTLFAGDSGNDLDVLLSPIKSILVANAHIMIKNTVLNALSIEKNKNSIYLAKGGFQNMNGNYSAGVLEGIQHYLPEIELWLEDKK